MILGDRSLVKYSGVGCLRNRESELFPSYVRSLIVYTGRAKKGRLGITVCWYFRPEQVRHVIHITGRALSNSAFNLEDLPSCATAVLGERGVQDQYVLPACTEDLCSISLVRSLRRPPSRRHHREDRVSIHRSSHPRQTKTPILAPWLALVCL